MNLMEFNLKIATIAACHGFGFSCFHFGSRQYSITIGVPVCRPERGFIVIIRFLLKWKARENG